MTNIEQNTFINNQKEWEVIIPKTIKGLLKTRITVFNNSIRLIILDDIDKDKETKKYGIVINSYIKTTANNKAEIFLALNHIVYVLKEVHLWTELEKYR
jgi:hypothetical protein